MNDCQTEYLAEVSCRLQQAADLTQAASKYMKQMEQAPELKAICPDNS